MLNISNYHRAKSIEEAYELNLKKNNVVLGGMLWLKMQRKNVGTAIDLCDLCLDKIEDMGDEYHIGAMVSLRDIETHAGLNNMTCNAFNDALKHLVGVQFRNLATIGGSIFARFGFSDILTALLTLDCKLEFHKKGIVSLESFVSGDIERDILTKIIIKKQDYRTVFLSHKNSKTDFPVLNCAVTEHEGEYICAVGARPQRATIVKVSKDDNTALLAKKVSDKLVFGDNMLASANYRQHICTVLITRAIEKLQEME